MADRWHLLKNLQDTLGKIIAQQSKVLREAAHLVQQKATETLQTTMKQSSSKKEVPSIEPTLVSNDKYAFLFKEIKQLKATGLSNRAIATQLSMSRNTVNRYVQQAHYQPKSSCSPTAQQWGEEVKMIWQQGATNVVEIFKILQEKGYTGSISAIYRITSKFPKQATVPQLPILNWTTRKVSALLFGYRDTMNQEEEAYLDALCKLAPSLAKARKLSIRFRSMLKNKKAALLSDWIKEAVESGIKELKNFAIKLKQDFDAVEAGIRLEWNNGQVEGQVNRLKNIKRQMYGRAGFELLKKRVVNTC